MQKLKDESSSFENICFYYKLSFEYFIIEMSKGDMTLVYYYVPEDKDDP